MCSLASKMSDREGLGFGVQGLDARKRRDSETERAIRSPPPSSYRIGSKNYASYPPPSFSSMCLICSRYRSPALPSEQEVIKYVLSASKFLSPNRILLLASKNMNMYTYTSVMSMYTSVCVYTIQTRYLIYNREQEHPAGLRRWF